MESQSIVLNAHWIFSVSCTWQYFFWWHQVHFLKLDSFGFPLMASKVPNTNMMVAHEGVNEWINSYFNSSYLVKVESGDLTSTLVRVTRMLTATALMTMQLILQRIFTKV